MKNKENSVFNLFLSLLSVKWDYIFYALILIAISTRLLLLNDIPCGINQDEAFAGYEAFSMLNFKTDSWGYKNPIYFISWGSGMNVLYSYLLKPLFYIFGYDKWVIRLPQALFSILSCYIIYKIILNHYNKKQALYCLFIIVIMPWHIITARYGVESFLLPSFMITGLYFYTQAFNSIKYLYLTSITYGLALYTYSVAWPIIFLWITFLYGYFLYLNKYQYKHIILSLLLLGIIALPLLLFILVNLGYIEEIKTTYISIPKLIYWRGNELGFDNLHTKFLIFKRLFFQQKDITIYTNPPKYGLFYLFSLPFAIIGIYDLCKRTKTDIKNKQFSINLCFLFWIIIGFIYALFIYVSSSRVNYIYIPLSIAIAFGAYHFSKYKYFFAIITLAYIYSFTTFAHFYFTNYNKKYQDSFSYGLEEALDYAIQKRAKNLYTINIIDASPIYPKVLWYQKISTPELISTIQYKKFPDAYLSAKIFSIYNFEDKFNKIIPDRIYIAKAINRYFFYQYDIKEFGNYIVAVPK